MTGPGLTITRDGATVALRRAPWDEPCLGVPVIELLEVTGESAAALDAALGAVDELCASDQIGLVTTRVAERAQPVVAALIRAGYCHVETSYPLRLAPLDVPGALRRGLAISPAVRADANALVDLAHSFEHSRYLEDQRIHPARGRARTAQWIVDSLSNGDEVMVARRHAAIAAVMSWRRSGDVVRLLLGGTAPDAGPIAPMFWAAIVLELAGRGVRAIETRVSAANDAALRLHRALGFMAGEPDLGMTKIYPWGAAIVRTSPASAPRADPDASRTT
ncbi:MAG: hypothetical protein AB7P03_10775 [Kofleriaceae bacterium]